MLSFGCFGILGFFGLLKLLMFRCLHVFELGDDVFSCVILYVFEFLKLSESLEFLDFFFDFFSDFWICWNLWIF